MSAYRERQHAAALIQKHPSKEKLLTGILHILLLNRLLSVKTVTLVKLINTTACVYKLLLSCEERMALGTDLDTDILLC